MSNLTKPIALAFTALILAFSQQPAWSDTHVDRPHDWTVTIETQQLPRQFEYHGSTLKPVCKAEVKYYHQTDDAHPTRYENMWFHAGKALGVERFHKFELERGDGVAINVTHKTDSPTTDEQKAAADALVHLVLDSYINKNPVVIVHVPAVSFSEISNELQAHHHFVTHEEAAADHPTETGIDIFIQSEPAGSNQTLSYF